jgi:hypothetical protein
MKINVYLNVTYNVMRVFQTEFEVNIWSLKIREKRRLIT